MKAQTQFLLYLKQQHFESELRVSDREKAKSTVHELPHSFEAMEVT
jgi:hypothetical protein